MTVRRFIVILLDLAATAIALLFSFLLRWGWDDFWIQSDRIIPACLTALPVAFLAYWAFGLASTPWKYFSASDLRRIAFAVCVPAVGLAAIDFMSKGALLVPRTVPAIYWFVQVFLLAGARLLYRSYRRQRQERRTFKGVHRVPILVAGTDDEAEHLIRRLQHDVARPMEVVGLLTAKARQVGERMLGVEVLGTFADLEPVQQALAARNLRPRRLIVTRDSLQQGAEIDTLLGTARQIGMVALRSTDAMAEVEAHGADVKLAPISIDDLLGRSSRELDSSAIRALVGGRRVVVTGAGGSIGSELCRQIAAMEPAGLMLFEQSELALYTVAKEIHTQAPGLEIAARLGNVDDRADVMRAFETFRPDLVFHAAALKHVDLVEAHPIAAARTNTLGTNHVADAALAVDALCAVFVSTDKAVHPVSILGATKRAGELVWAASGLRARQAGRRSRFLSVRFGNVLGSSGSVIPLFTEQLGRGGPITVTHPEVERYFMTISEAVTLMLMASALGATTEEAAPTYVLDMGEPIRIVDLALRMIRLAGLQPDRDIEIVFSGLRPGERLSEVLEHDNETLRPTPIPGVRSADQTSAIRPRLKSQLGALAASLATGDEAAIRRVLGELVPDYTGTPEPMAAPAMLERQAS